MLLSLLGSTLALASTVLAAPAPGNIHLEARTLDFSSRFNRDNVTVASIRAPPVGWLGPSNSTSPLPRKTFAPNITASAKLGAQYIADAAAQGADLVVFPELWFPGHIGDSPDLQVYYDNALELDSPEWDIIVEAVRKAGVYVAIAFSEKQAPFLYMSQALFAPSGDLLIHRQKLRPSGGERFIFSDGYIRDIKVVDTALGRIGLLECYEHFHPSMTVIAQAQSEQIHIGPFPYQRDYGAEVGGWWENMDVNGGAARVYATEGNTYFVFAAIGLSETFNNEGLSIGKISEYSTEPFLLTYLNTTIVEKKAYDVNAQESWGLVSQLASGWPSSVPKDNGTFFNHQTINFPALIKGYKNATEISAGILDY